MTGIRDMAACPVDVFDVPLAQLPALIAHPHSQELVTVKCNDGRHVRARCDTEVICRRIDSVFVACDACRQKAIDDKATERHAEYWKHVCPERFRVTDVKHKDFPAAIFADLKKGMNEKPNQSLFLYGPTGAGKTRVAMMLMKLQLHWWNRRVGVLWPEKVRTLSQGFETTTFDHYAGYDVLLMDDSLLTAVREPKLMDSIKQLVDVRMRHDRPFIITSQIGSEDDLKDGKEFGEAKSADIERIKALLRRLREDCRVVSFATAEPKPGESAF